jgi:transcriptional regulator with XRE-family HTH domain
LQNAAVPARREGVGPVPSERADGASATGEPAASSTGRRGADPARPLGEIIRAQRRLARLSLRQLAAMSAVSNPYLSQIERGLHEPSFRVLQAVADALDMSVEVMLGEAGMLRVAGREGAGGDEDASAGAERGEPAAGDEGSATERAIAADPRLSADQRAALLSVYRSYVGAAPPPR